MTIRDRGLGLRILEVTFAVFSTDIVVFTINGTSKTLFTNKDLDLMMIFVKN